MGNKKIYAIAKKDPDGYLKPAILINNKEVFKDTLLRFSYYLEGDNKLVRIKNSESFYLLMHVRDAPDSDKYNVFLFEGDVVKNVGSSICDIFEDIDGDGFMEVGGAELIESPCFPPPCDSTYYNPVNIFKLSESYEFDTINSQKLTKEKYGIYLGSKQLYIKVKRIK